MQSIHSAEFIVFCCHCEKLKNKLGTCGRRRVLTSHCWGIELQPAISQWDLTCLETHKDSVGVEALTSKQRVQCDINGVLFFVRHPCKTTTKSVCPPVLIFLSLFVFVLVYSPINFFPSFYCFVFCSVVLSFPLPFRLPLVSSKTLPRLLFSNLCHLSLYP